MLNEDTIKQVFFYCDQHEPDALVADDVDIVQFARRIEQMVVAEERARCVAIVKGMNLVMGEALENQISTSGGA